MKIYIYIVLLCGGILSACTTYPTAMTPSSARLSKKEYKEAIEKEKAARKETRIKVSKKRQGVGLTFYAWNEFHKAEAKKLPVRERASYMKQATARLVDSILTIKRFGFSSDHGMQFGQIARPYLAGSLRLYDSVLRCAFERPLFFWSEQFDYNVIAKSDKKTDIEIIVHRATTIERSKIDVSESPFAFLLKLTVCPNREAELAVCSPDGKSVHVRGYGFIWPLGEQIAQEYREY